MCHLRPGLPACRLAAALLGLLLSSTPTVAQFASLSGFVTDASDGRPLEGVNLVLLHPDGRFAKGTASTRDGLYVLRRLDPGPYTLSASYIGYQPAADTLTLDPDASLVLNLALTPHATTLDEAVVEADADAGATRLTAGLQTIRPADLERVPTPDVSGDLASYLTTLPGVVSTGDRGGQLFIRGGEPTQNLVLLDGMVVHQPFHLLGFYSAFPSAVVQRADLYAGGYGSRYGGRLSSVIAVETRNGNVQGWAGSVSVSPFLGSVVVEGPVVRERLSVLVSGRQSLVEQGAERLVDQPLPFVFGDVLAKLHAVVNDRGRASMTMLYTYDRGTLGEPRDGRPADEIRSGSRALGARYLFLPDQFSSTIDIRVAHTRLTSELGPPTAPVRRSSIENDDVSFDITVFREWATMYVGAMIRLNVLESELGGLYQNVENQQTIYGEWGNYVEFDLHLSDAWVLRPGLRMQVYGRGLQPYLEPRLRAVWTHGVHQLSAAAGLYHQELVGLSDRRDAASVFTVWTQVPPSSRLAEDVLTGRLQRAVHGLLGYQVRPAPWLDVSVEGFYKHYDNLFVAEWTAYPRLTTRLQPASGRSLGFDTRAEVRWKSLYGFLSYGLSSTRYTAEQANLPVWYGQETLPFRPPHDRRHQINALLSLPVRGFDVNLHWSFGSGLPFNQALGFDGFVLIDDVVDATRVPSARRVIYERPYNGLLPSYHRLDVSVDRTFELAGAAVTVQASLINAYNRHNLYYFDLFTLQRVNQLPFIPSFGLKMDWH